jgi:RNA-dependent RNA polymerase
MLSSFYIDYRILHDYNDNMTKMYDRIKKILMHGVNVCDRNYQFLAFSSSQLREHSCWMFSAPDNVTTVDSIRNWMGEFRNIHPVAKYAARVSKMKYSVFHILRIYCFSS